MSSRQEIYAFPQRAFLQPKSHRQRDSSPDRTLSDASSPTDSKDVHTTPPTPYLGDDELSGDLSSTSDSNGLQHTKAGVPPIKPERATSDVSEDEEQAVDEDERSSTPVDSICAGETDGPCTLGSGDHRKVVSHIFGRNKRCTHQIPEDCWIKYCRKHYQRQKYRCPTDWFETQLLLIDGQIDKMESWGGISSWKIDIRKKEREMLAKEDAYNALHGRLPDGTLCRERFLRPYLGDHKSFRDIRDVVDLIDKECNDTGNTKLPSFEFLPTIDDRRNPRPKRGASRRQLRIEATAAPSSFRLSTDADGKVVKIEAPTGHKTETASAGSSSRTSSLTPVYAPSRRPLPPAKTQYDHQSRSSKRSASSLDEDEDSPDMKNPLPVKRQNGAHAEREIKPVGKVARPVKHQAPTISKPEEKSKPNPSTATLSHRPNFFERYAKKPEIANERPRISHQRSLSF